ncbi:MAG: hypothetical protein ACSHXK_13370 [Oceanococcus sp.]
MKYKNPVFLLIAAAVSLPVQAADCQRKDIDHYLDRGFTPKQVLELCRGGASEQSPAQVDTQAQQLNDLRELIDAKNMSLSPDSWDYTQEMCVEYDRPNYAQQRKKACGIAHYRISRKGLVVQDTRKKLAFWGANEVVLHASAVLREFELGQADLSERNQRELERELPSGNTVVVPVREGVAVSEAKRQIQALAVSE